MIIIIIIIFFFLIFFFFLEPKKRVVPEALEDMGAFCPTNFKNLFIFGMMRVVSVVKAQVTIFSGLYIYIYICRNIEKKIKI